MPNETVHDERVKITAAVLNGIAIAVFVIGTFAPTVQAMWNAEAHAIDWSLTVLIGGICIGASGALRGTGSARRSGMTMETVALLVAPVGGLILGLVVFLVARRAARRDLDSSNPKPVPHTRH